MRFRNSRSRCKLQLCLQIMTTSHASPARDTHVAEQLQKNEILSMVGKPYGVFMPYKYMWLKTVNDFYVQPYPVDAYLHNLAQPVPTDLISLEAMGFQCTNLASMRLLTGRQGGLSLFDDFKQRINRYTKKHAIFLQ